MCKEFSKNRANNTKKNPKNNQPTTYKMENKTSQSHTIY